jgi:hypothetical protein
MLLEEPNMERVATWRDNCTGLVEGLIHATGVAPADRVTIAGRKILSLFTALCERTFLHANCRTAAGPCAAEDEPDSIWVINVTTEEELVDLIEVLCRHVRPGGTVAIDLSSPAAKTFPFRVRRALIQSGFLPAQQKAIMIAGEVYLIARKGIPQQAIAA